MSAFAVTLIEGLPELAEMRKSLASWLKLTDASSDIRDAVLLATHEAAANAMVHGEPESPVVVEASQHEDGGFAIAVTNGGRWKEPGPGHNGRGLVMMTELMSEVAIHTRVHMRS
jgi:anti-sigma regulatory factor (Ser/Thr protein kinase)